MGMTDKVGTIVFDNVSLCQKDTIMCVGNSIKNMPVYYWNSIQTQKKYSLWVA